MWKKKMLTRSNTLIGRIPIRCDVMNAVPNEFAKALSPTCTRVIVAEPRGQQTRTRTTTTNNNATTTNNNNRHTYNGLKKCQCAQQ